MTKTAIKTTRNGTGAYTVSNGKYHVEVIRFDEFLGPDKWIARALWDQHRYSDPVATKREAVTIAINMINQPWFNR
jgi:hypothetical protein